jgi:hypothetical protein
MKEEKQEKVSVKQEDPTQRMEPSPPPKDVPPAPEMDPRYGDKTPAYAEWLHKFYPEKAAQLYSGRKVMGKHIPPGATKLDLPEAKPLTPMGGDIPEDAMAKERKEEWL